MLFATDATAPARAEMRAAHARDARDLDQLYQQMRTCLGLLDSVYDSAHETHYV